jgi:hypothetical protein
VANQFTKEFAANLEKLVREDAPPTAAAAAKPVSGLACSSPHCRAMIARVLHRKIAA